MVFKVTTTCLQWSQPILPNSTSSSPNFTSALLYSSPSCSKRRSRGEKGALMCPNVHKLDRCFLFGTPSTSLQRSRSYEYPKSKFPTIKRACSASFNDFSDEEFSKKIQELALRFQLSDDRDVEEEEEETEMVSDSGVKQSCTVNFVEKQSQYPNPIFDSVNPPWPEIRREPLDWPEYDEIVLSSIERKANSVELPFSLRIIKRKLKWQEGFRETGESAYCSMKKAFSSMVFIIRELQRYTLQMREILYYEDLRSILNRVQKEMNISFVWLFQQVFSHTPTLMVYVMILLANFTVHSMGHNIAIANPLSPGSYSSKTELASMVEIKDQKNQKFDTSVIKTFSVNFSSVKSISIGGNNGSGGNFRPVGSGPDGDGGFDHSGKYRTIIPDEVSQISSITGKEESISGQDVTEEEDMWNSVVDEASKMEASVRDETMDKETIQLFVSPVNSQIEPQDYKDYFRTELMYQACLFQEPNNVLLLGNYAQFLYLVAHDFDRAEEYFKRAIRVEPADAEAYNKYATFLWKVRNDLWAAEETFLETIAAEPTNAYHAATYANFLWNTGGEDTCSPLSSLDDATQSNT